MKAPQYQNGLTASFGQSVANVCKCVCMALKRNKTVLVGPEVAKYAKYGGVESAVVGVCNACNQVVVLLDVDTNPG